MAGRKDQAGDDEAAQENVPDRSSEAASAQMYADHGIVGAPGSEVKWPSSGESDDDESDDKGGGGS